MSNVAPAGGGAPVAVVTGAARGIGAATARRLARAGWQLVLVDVCADDPGLSYPLATKEDLSTVVEECGQLGSPAALAQVSDVRDRAGLDRAVRLAKSELGGLDAAVAVAGAILGGARAWELSDEEWAAMIGINLSGVFQLARAAVPVLLARSRPRRGRFVAVSSAGGLVGLPRLAAYSAAKHGVVGLVRSLAAELGGEEITANVVAPGSTRTAMLDASAEVYGLSGAAELARHHLDERLLEPEEVAEMVAFCCSVESSGVTGAVLSVDAGMTAR